MTAECNRWNLDASLNSFVLSLALFLFKFAHQTPEKKTFWSRLMAKSSQIQWENKNYHVSLFLCAWAIVEITYFANSYKSVIHNDTTRKKGAKITIVAHKIQ